MGTAISVAASWASKDSSCRVPEHSLKSIARAWYRKPFPAVGIVLYPSRSAICEHNRNFFEVFPIFWNFPDSFPLTADRPEERFGTRRETALPGEACR